MTSMIYFHGVAWRRQQKENEKEQSSRMRKVSVWHLFRDTKNISHSALGENLQGGTLAK